MNNSARKTKTSRKGFLHHFNIYPQKSMKSTVKSSIGVQHSYEGEDIVLGAELVPE